MDLTMLVKRLGEQQNTSNRILTFENGQVVERNHATVYRDVKAACAALSEWGVRPGMRVGIRAPNSYQWIIHDLALIELRAVLVAFTDDFNATPVEYLFEKYSLSLLLVPSSDREPKPAGLPVALLDGANGAIHALPRGAQTADPNFERMGLIFSSGSSGGVKGMTLNRRGVEDNVDSFTQAVGPRPDDRLLLFLPISNFQQRLMYYSALWHGFDLIVTDPSRLFRALQDLHPTILIAPPTLYEALETRFSNLPQWKQWMANLAGNLILGIPVATVRARLGRRMFQAAHAALGGRMRFMITGMAPIKRSTLKLMARMQMPLYETYGLVECGPVALNLPGAHKIGSVGRLLPGASVEFGEDGEIIATKKATMTSGYFECVAGEAENTYIGGNRIATGDIGRMDQDGFLYITGRKKEIIITAGGQKVHPEALEAEIDACPEVSRAVVFRAPDEPFLSAVVLPKNPGDTGARARIEQFIEAMAARKPVFSIGRIIFTDIVFTRENGFLRPNLKLDRKKIARHFEQQAQSPQTAQATDTSLQTTA